MSGHIHTHDTELGELRILEQNLTHLLMQRQSLESELNEISNAKSEVEASDGEVYTIAGSVMLRSTKQKILKELESKKKLAETHISSIEKQQKLIESKADELQKEIQKSNSQNKK